jgi:hypothetical protein
MNHFKIMVLHKKVDLFTSHRPMGCRFLVMLHPNIFGCLCIPNSNHSNHKCKVLDARPNSLKDSNMSLKVKITKKKELEYAP